MSENLMNSDHKSSTKVTRINPDIIFGNKCEYHGGRSGAELHNGL